MDYPKIIYPVIRYRVQSKNDCAVYAICRLMEMVMRQKGIEKYFDEKDLEEKFLIWDVKEGDNTGTDTEQALEKLQEHGFQGYDFWYNKIRKGVVTGKRTLRRTPFLARLRCFRKKSERVVNGYYKAFPKTKKIGSGHIVVVVGWNGEGFIIQDSNYTQTYIMKPDEYKFSVTDCYTIRM